MTGSYKRKEVIGDCTLYLGDCLEVMEWIGPFYAIVTDPPYGIGAANGASGGGTDASGRYKRKPRQYAGDWDNSRPSRAVFTKMQSIAAHQIIWGGNYFADWLPQSGRWLFWDKLNSMPTYSDGEMAWTSLKGDVVKKFTRCNNGMASNRDGERVHPTQKPIDLMSWCIDFLPGAGAVLDPFMGSGTTGVACVKRGRSFVGIERDPGYFDIACQRIRDAYAEPDMFVTTSAPQQEQLSILGDA